MKFNKKPNGDKSFLIGLGILSLFMFSGGLYLTSQSGGLEFYFVLILTAFCCIVFTHIIAEEKNTYYILKEDSILIRRGFFKSEMSYNDIELINGYDKEGVIFFHCKRSLKDFHTVSPDNFELFKKQFTQKIKKECV